MIILLISIFSCSLSPECSFLILACDGVWDVFTDDDAVAFVAQAMENMVRMLEFVCPWFLCWVCSLRHLNKMVFFVAAQAKESVVKSHRSLSPCCFCLSHASFIFGDGYRVHRLC